MAEVQELIIKYRADVEDLQQKVSQIEAELRKVPSAANQAGTATTQAFQKTGTEAKKATTNVGDFSAKVKASVTDVKPISDQFANLGKSIVAAFAVERIIQFGFESVKAFQEAEKNAVKLQSAVSVNGGLQHDFDELIKQSKELQEITIFSDDDIQRAQTAALQFGLTREQVQKLIPAVTDFASATGQDLQSALEGILQGVNGSERALKKYGVTVSENGTRASRLAEISDQLNKKFKDQAQVIGNTAFGAAERYKNEVDELSESLGEKLSPAFQFARQTALELVEAFGELTGIIQQDEFTIQFNKYKEGFKSKFSTLGIDDLNRKFKELSDSQQKLSGTARTLQLAQMAAVLELIKQKAAEAKKPTDELAKILERLKNISSISDTELQKLLQTLNGLNDINAADAIDAINKELEARQKGTAKAIEEKRKGLEELNKLEQKASDRILAVKAEEVSKVQKLEQDKQKELRDLIDAAGTASGADVEPIVLEFESTGRVDIERTIDLLKQAKFPQAEIDKFTLAVGRTNSAFDILISKQTQASKELELKINAENIQSDFDDLQAQFETFQEREEILLQVKFIQAGDFSPEAIKKLDADIVASRAKTNEELVRQAQQMGVDINVINKLIAANAKAANEEEIKANAEKTAAILAQEQELAQRRKDLIEEIKDTAIEFTTTLISDTIDNRAEADIKAVELARDTEVAAIDERIAKNDERAQKGIIGEREAEKNHEKLLQDKKKADDRADNAERQIKRRQFRNDQLSSVGKVVIANTVNAAEFPALAAFYAALAIAQSAIILSQPNPYKKGSKKTKPGLAIVGEEGPEFVMMPSAAKVVPAQKTKQHEKVIDAIMDNNLEQHVEKTFVQPRLEEERKKQAKKDSKIINEVLSKKDSRQSTEDITSKKVGEEKISSKSLSEQTISSKNETKDSKKDSRSFSEIVNLKSVNDKSSNRESSKEKTESKSFSDLSFETVNEKRDERQYSSIVEAMYMGKVDEYLKQIDVQKEIKKEVLTDSVINHRELNNILSNLQIAPVLKQAEKENEQRKQEDFATNIANSIILNNQGMTRKDYYEVSTKNRRKGMPITNAHEIVDPIIEALQDKFPMGFRR